MFFVTDIFSSLPAAAACPKSLVLPPRRTTQNIKTKMNKSKQTEPKRPTAVTLNEQQFQNLGGFDVSGLQLNGLNNESLTAAVGSSTARSAKKAAAAERVVAEAVDAAILSRKASEPDKWAMIESEAVHHPAGMAVAGGGGGVDGGDATFQGSLEGGGSRYYLFRVCFCTTRVCQRAHPCNRCHPYPYLPPERLSD